MATITSADNLSSVPSDNGIAIGGEFGLDIVGGTAINAELQKLDSEDNWVKVPDANADITAAYSKVIKSGGTDRYRVYVTSATGTWSIAWTKLFA